MSNKRLTYLRLRNIRGDEAKSLINKIEEQKELSKRDVRNAKILQAETKILVRSRSALYSGMSK